MRSSLLSTNKDLSLETPLSHFFKKSASLEKIMDAGIKTFWDLLWFIPLRSIHLPKIQAFSFAKHKEYFAGKGEVVSIKSHYATNRRGIKKAPLFNIQVVVKDHLSSNSYFNIRWFNVYPNQKKIIESLTEFSFLGVVDESTGIKQIVNPKINFETEIKDNLLIEYSTLNKVPGEFFKKLLSKLPIALWDKIIDDIPSEILKKREFISLKDAFKILHGLSSMASFEEAKKRLIYEDFISSHLKVHARREFLKNKKSISLPDVEFDISLYRQKFPYSLTSDQNRVIEEIFFDLKSGSPMMRLVQGDVGCGKTTVAIIISLLLNELGYQVALMCPTETLALQHYETFKEIYDGSNFKISCLLGGTKAKEKNIIGEELKNGGINLIIGTHTLFQKNIEFKNLGLAIIDEQHKFGVDQRISLIKKGDGVHALLMSATPIPRTLQLAHYGDLDISTIKTMPANRKGIKTRIITQENYKNFLSFIKTRISLGEQVYVVAPAIEENEEKILKNVEEIFKLYKNYFSEMNISILHGKMTSKEKDEVIQNFSKNKSSILISTSVIEVGINIPNATVMAIYQPERFGLSSLHQLRGRVGRGEKAGFCFLVTESSDFTRLQILEQSNDGFVIAEKDLQNRGSGDLFGEIQSGHVSSHKIGDVFTNFDLFNQASEDLKDIIKNKPEYYKEKISLFINDLKVSTTI